MHRPPSAEGWSHALRGRLSNPRRPHLGRRSLEGSLSPITKGLRGALEESMCASSPPRPPHKAQFSNTMDRLAIKVLEERAHLARAVPVPGDARKQPWGGYRALHRASGRPIHPPPGRRDDLGYRHRPPALRIYGGAGPLRPAALPGRPESGRERPCERGLRRSSLRLAATVLRESRHGRHNDPHRRRRSNRTRAASYRRSGRNRWAGRARLDRGSGRRSARVSGYRIDLCSPLHRRPGACGRPTPGSARRGARGVWHGRVQIHRLHQRDRRYPRLRSVPPIRGLERGRPPQFHRASRALGPDTCRDCSALGARWGNTPHPVAHLGGAARRGSGAAPRRADGRLLAPRGTDSLDRANRPRVRRTPGDRRLGRAVS